MTSAITTAHPANPTTARPLRDLRGFWRVLLAVIAPLPMLAKGVYYLLVPVEGGASFEDTFAAFAAHRDLIDVLVWLDAVFVVGLIPATYAVAWVARRGAPRLTTAGAVISLVGFFAGIALLGGAITPSGLAVQHNLDPAAVAALDRAAEGHPLVSLASLLFIVGVVLGLGLLGAGLWRSGYVPAWAGIAVMAGGITHPFIPHHVGQGIGLLVAAVGYAGAGVALLRMGNDGFDLPPARPAP